MKTNIFLNTYQQAENQLTYNFLSVLELLNSKAFCEFLTACPLDDKPVHNIQTVYGGGESNPDGSFDLKKQNGEAFTVYFENKTHRRDMSVIQLNLHLLWLKGDDRLLVVTPRKSDIDLIRQMNNKKIIFFTWQEIAAELKKENDPVCEQFIDYGKVRGEFEELGELHSTDIEIFCAYAKTNYQAKLNTIINHFHHEVDLNKYGFPIRKRLSYAWGRSGTEFINGNYELIDPTINTYGQFWAIAYYHDTRDHGIPFKKDQPEICVFFDVHQHKKATLQSDEAFKTILAELVQKGFESNLYNEISRNSWRLFFYRKPISEFGIISVAELLRFTEEVFSKLLSVNVLKHPYFSELQKPIQA